MYCQSFFVISVRGIGLVPTTAPSAASGCIGFMNAAFGVRFAPPFFAVVRFALDFFAPPRALDFFAALFFAPPFFAAFLAPFFAAILSPGRWNGWGLLCEGARFPYENERLQGRKVYAHVQDAIGKCIVFPLKTVNFPSENACNACDARYNSPLKTRSARPMPAAFPL